MTQAIAKRPQRGPGGKVPLGQRVARMRALQAIPPHRLSNAEAEELDRLEAYHIRRLPLIPDRIARLKEEIAVLEGLLR